MWFESTHSHHARIERLIHRRSKRFRSFSASAQHGLLREVLRRRGQIYMSRTLIPVHLQTLIGRSEITRSLRTRDRREAMGRLNLWETHVGCLLNIIRRQGARMTREQLDRLVAEYTAASFDEIEC